MVKRVINHGVKIDGASDHTISKAVYLSDPDGNGVELCVDRDPSQWIDQEGNILLTVEPLDLDSLLSELDTAQ